MTKCLSYAISSTYSRIICSWLGWMRRSLLMVDGFGADVCGMIPSLKVGNETDLFS